MFWLLSCNAGREASTREVQRELSSIGAMIGASIREVQGACGCCQRDIWYPHAPKEQTKLPECIFDPVRRSARVANMHTSAGNQPKYDQLIGFVAINSVTNNIVKSNIICSGISDENFWGSEIFHDVDWLIEKPETF